MNPHPIFHSHNYLRHNARRLEHLASLNIPVFGKIVLEVGAGIGDHSHYYIDRGCDITITDVRNENIEFLKERYPKEKIHLLDLDNPIDQLEYKYEIIHCYGLLYHLKNPEKAIKFLASKCSGLLFLETCVSFGEEEILNPITEDSDNATQAVSGTGCRPTRKWIFNYLKKCFPFVYITKTQPNHEEFPIDWVHPEYHTSQLIRSVFIASFIKLDNPNLSEELLDYQIRHS